VVTVSGLPCLLLSELWVPHPGIVCVAPPRLVGTAPEVVVRLFVVCPMDAMAWRRGGFVALVFCANSSVRVRLTRGVGLCIFPSL
jgi:hypothetical protein